MSRLPKLGSQNSDKHGEYEVKVSMSKGKGIVFRHFIAITGQLGHNWV